MNEVFKKLKTCILCIGSACAAFLLFMLCGKKLHNNRSTDDRIKEATDGIQGTTDRLRTTTERFKDANGRLEKLIEDIEETGVKKKMLALVVCALVLAVALAVWFILLLV